MRTLAIVNQKGGVGKTTAAVNIGAGLAARGFSTLLIDADAGAGLTTSLRLSPDRTLYDFVTGKGPPVEYAESARDNLDVICGAKGSTAALDAELRADTGRGTLRERLSGGGYDYAVIDTGPGYSVLNVNAIRASHSVCVPITLDFLALTGLAAIAADVDAIRNRQGTAGAVQFIIPSFYDVRRRLTGEAMDILRRSYKGLVTPPIRINVRIAEAPGHAATIYEYDRRKGKVDFDNLVTFMLRKGI